MSQKQDKPKGHWVPASYLKQWCQPDESVTVCRIRDGIEIKQFPQNPDKIFRKPGYYLITDETFEEFRDLLEIEIFAHALEKRFIELMRSTFHKSIIPTPTEIASIADYCYELYIRNPQHQKLYLDQLKSERPEHYDKIEAFSFGTKILMGSIMIRVHTSYRKIYLINAPEGYNFYTSDTPCWEWIIFPTLTTNGWTTDNPSWETTFSPQQWLKMDNTIQREFLKGPDALSSVAQLCPLCPKWAMITFPYRSDAREAPPIEIIENNPILVDSINFYLRSAIDQFLIIPPGGVRPEF